MSNDFGMYPVSAPPSLDPATVRAFVNPMMSGPTTATSPGPSFGAETSTQQPDMMQMVMDSLTQGGQKIDDLYTTYQKLLDTQSALLEKAGGAPSETQEQADVLKKHKEALDIEIGKMRSAHVPDAPVFDTPNYPALNLPSAPVAQQARPNPIAQLMAAVAGFVRPSAANQFNAAALQGSILHANQQNQQAEKLFQDNVQIIQAHHADEIQRENARIKVAQANKEGKYTTDVAKFHEEMLEADKERQSQELGGEAEVLGKFAEAKKPSDDAKMKLGLLAPQVTSTEKLMASMLQRQEQLLSHASTLQYQKEYHDEQAKQAKQKEKDTVAYHGATLKEHYYSVDQSNKTRREIAAGVHNDVIARINARGGSGAKSLMEHPDFYMAAAKEVMDEKKQQAHSAYTDLQKSAATDAGKQSDAEMADVARARREYELRQQEFDAATDEYKKAGEAMRARGGVHVAPGGVGPAVITGPGFSLTPK